MAERASTYSDQRTANLKGLSERLAETNYPPGVFDLLRGLYPARTGLLQRIPGHDHLVDGTGARIVANGRIMQIHATGNANGDVLVQTEAGLYAYTVDELFARSTTPALTDPPLTEEDSMSMAIIIQREANATVGGSMQGYLTGADASSAANTFYGRRLTNLVCNESSAGVPTVSSFTASTGGGGVVSTPGQFVLVPGTYRVTGRFSFTSVTANVAFLCGLYNFSDGAFQCHYDGVSNNIPILGSVVSSDATARSNMLATFEARILVAAGSNKTFQIMQECSTVAGAQALKAGGDVAGVLTTANVNGAAATLEYGSLKILRTA